MTRTILLGRSVGAQTGNERDSQTREISSDESGRDSERSRTAQFTLRHHHHLGEKNGALLDSRQANRSAQGKSGSVVAEI